MPCRELIHKGATELLIDVNFSDVITSKVRNFIGDSSEEEFSLTLESIAISMARNSWQIIGDFTSTWQPPL